MMVEFERGYIDPNHTCGTRGCLAYHLFACLPLLANVSIADEPLRVYVRIRLYRRAWWWLGFAHRRALRLARLVVAVNKPLGVSAIVYLG